MYNEVERIEEIIDHLCTVDVNLLSNDALILVHMYLVNLEKAYLCWFLPPQPWIKVRRLDVENVLQTRGTLSLV